MLLQNIFCAFLCVSTWLTVFTAGVGATKCRDAFACGSGLVKKLDDSIECNSDAVCCDRGLPGLAGWSDVYNAWKGLLERCNGSASACIPCPENTPETLAEAPAEVKCRCMKEARTCARYLNCSGAATEKTCQTITKAIAQFEPEFSCDVVCDRNATDQSKGAWSFIYRIIEDAMKECPNTDTSLCHPCPAYTRDTIDSAPDAAKCQCLKNSITCAAANKCSVPVATGMCTAIRDWLYHNVPTFSCDIDCSGGWPFVYRAIEDSLMACPNYHINQCHVCTGFTALTIDQATDAQKCQCLKDSMECSGLLGCDPAAATATCSAILIAINSSLPNFRCDVDCSGGWAAAYNAFENTLRDCPNPNQRECKACAQFSAANISLAATDEQKCQCVKDSMACAVTLECNPGPMTAVCKAVTDAAVAAVPNFYCNVDCGGGWAFAYLAFQTMLQSCPKANQSVCNACPDFTPETFGQATDAQKCQCIQNSMKCAIDFGCDVQVASETCYAVMNGIRAAYPTFPCNVDCSGGWGFVYRAIEDLLTSCPNFHDNKCAVCEGYTPYTIASAPDSVKCQCLQNSTRCAALFGCDPSASTSICNGLANYISEAFPSLQCSVDCSGGWPYVYRAFEDMVRDCPNTDGNCAVCEGYTVDTFEQAPDAVKCQCAKDAMKCAVEYSCDATMVAATCNAVKAAVGPYLPCAATLDCGISDKRMCDSYVCTAGTLKDRPQAIAQDWSCTSATCCNSLGSAFKPPQAIASDADLHAVVLDLTGFPMGTMYAKLNESDRAKLVETVAASGTQVVASGNHAQLLVSDISSIVKPMLKVARNDSSASAVYLRNLGNSSLIYTAVVTVVAPEMAKMMNRALPSIPSTAGYGRWVTDVITITRLTQTGAVVSTSTIQFDVPCPNGPTRIGVCHFDDATTSSNAVACEAVQSIATSDTLASFCTITHNQTSSFLAYAIDTCAAVLSDGCPAGYGAKKRVDFLTTGCSSLTGCVQTCCVALLPPYDRPDRPAVLAGGAAHSAMAFKALTFLAMLAMWLVIS